jgi:hypothetical protein
MLEQTDRVAVQHSLYEEMPFFQVLFRYLWPFWLFKDASRGDRWVRAAAYRHNREMRVYLPGYLLKWAFNCTLAYAVATRFDSLSSAHTLDLFTLLAAGCGVVFACGLCVLFVTAYIYVYLGKNAT